MKKYLTAIAFGVTATPVTAVSLAELATCYSRTYEIQQLATDPRQNVTQLSLSIDAGGNAVTLTGENRTGQTGYLRLSCVESPGSATTDPDCYTFELESQISLTPTANGDLIMITRGTFLSDIGGLYGYGANDEADHYRFFLHGAPADHNPGRIGSGPYDHYVLSPADDAFCPPVKSGA